MRLASLLTCEWLQSVLGESVSNKYVVAVVERRRSVIVSHQLFLLGLAITISQSAQCGKNPNSCRPAGNKGPVTIRD